MGAAGIQLLRELSNVLDAATRPAGALAEAVRVMVPMLGDSCMIRIGDGSGELITSGLTPPTIGERSIEVAICHRGERLGALHLQRAGGRPDWTEEELLIAEECASRIGASLEERHLTEAAATAAQYDGFLATLSHELRTPLNVIIGWVELLRGDKLAVDKRGQGLAIVERNARVQVRLIEDILEASRIVSGKLRLELANVPAVDLVVGAVESLRPLAEAAKISLDARTCPVFDLRADGVRLGQVVSNLVGNSLRYTPPGGRVDVALDRDGDHAVLSVADDGLGIDPNLLPHIFERFRQGERKRSAGSRGLGLGLFIVRHIVELHGGTVNATSPGRGQGSVFTVRLPLSGPA